MGLGFAIGRALNLGAKFATGAGAFDSIGKIGKAGSLLQKGTSLAGGALKSKVGGGFNAGAGASLSDRLKSGFSAVSPTFAKSQALAGQLKSQGIADTAAQMGIDRAAQAAKKVGVRSIFGSSIEPGAIDWAVDNFRKRGLVTVNPDTGDEEIELGKAMKVQEDFMNDPQQRLEMMTHNSSSVDRDIIKEEKKGEAIVIDEAKKLMKTKGEDYDTALPERQKAARFNVIKGFEEGSIVNKEGTTILANVEALRKKSDMWDSKIDNLKQSQIDDVEQSKIDLNKANLLKSGTSSFESSPKIETMARGMFGGRSVSQLQPHEINEVMKRVEKEDPKRIELMRQHRNDFEKQPVIADYDSTMGRADDMETAYLASKNMEGKPRRNAADQVIVTNFNKIIDANSTVRTPEFDRTPENLSTTEKFKAWVLRFSEGGILTDDAREEIINVSRALSNGYEERAQEKARQMTEVANGMGFPPEFIVTNPRLRGLTEGSTTFLGEGAKGEAGNTAPLDDFLQTSGQPQPGQAPAISAPINDTGQALGPVSAGAGAAIQREPGIRDVGPSGQDSPFTFGGG